MKYHYSNGEVFVCFVFFCGGEPRPISHRVGRSVRTSIGLSHFAFVAFLGILRVGKFVQWALDLTSLKGLGSFGH